MLTKRRAAVLLAALTIGIAAPAVAFANPSVVEPPTSPEVLPPEVTPPEVIPPEVTEPVEPPAGGVEGTVPPEETVTETVTGSSLPFTGFPALIVLGTGVGLAVGGIALRRATRSKSD